MVEIHSIYCGKFIAIYCRKFTELLKSVCLRQYIDSPTHELGGTLDIIVVPCHQPPKDIAVDDVGFSDHSLLLQTINLAPPPLGDLGDGSSPIILSRGFVHQCCVRLAGSTRT